MTRMKAKVAEYKILNGCNIYSMSRCLLSIQTLRISSWMSLSDQNCSVRRRRLSRLPKNWEPFQTSKWKSSWISETRLGPRILNIEFSWIFPVFLWKGPLLRSISMLRFFYSFHPGMIWDGRWNKPSQTCWTGNQPSRGKYLFCSNVNQ